MTLKTTPAVAAGVTDHAWTMEEALEFVEECLPKSRTDRSDTGSELLGKVYPDGTNIRRPSADQPVSVGRTETARRHRAISRFRLPPKSRRAGGCPESPHPITTPEWMRGDWEGPLLEDGSAPTRVTITAHEIRFKGSRTLELLSIPHSEVVISPQHDRRTTSTS